MTALVGSSGAGKTTVTRLLMRYADPQQGRITIGDTDLRQIPSEALSDLISVVFQDVYLFDGSVLANIRMARPEASEDEVRAAAKAAQCLTFIERLPKAGTHGWERSATDFPGRAPAYLDCPSATQERPNRHPR